MSTSLDANARLGAMLSGRLDERRDFAWLASPHGLAWVCRSVLQGGPAEVLTDPNLDELLALLDDYLPHLAGHSGSDRARALVSIASGRPDLARREFGSMEAVEVVTQLLTGRSPEPLGQATAAALTSRHADGQVIDLALTLLPGPPVIVPDVRAAPLMRCDDVFAQALRDAVEVAGRQSTGTVVWAAFSQRTRAPLDVIVGPSVGLAAALAARRLTLRNAAPLDPSWVFTGAIDRQGRTVSLLDADADTTSYLAKVTAAGDRSVIVPAVDAGAVSEMAMRNSLPAKVVGAATVDEAELLLTRHLAGKIGWERALAGRPVDPHAHRKVGLALLAAVVPLSLVLIAGWWANHKWQDRQARARAHGAVATIHADGTTFDIFRFEVSNAQYRACVASGPCEAARVDGVTVDDGDPSLGPYPVVGVTWLQAATFCDWVGARLPTFTQWQQAVEERGQNEWPMNVKDPQLLGDRPKPWIEPNPAALPGLDVVAYLIGNVQEWTNTVCTSSCQPQPPGNRNVLGTVRIVGLDGTSISSPQVYPPGDASWLELDHNPDDFVNPKHGAATLGFRCASEPGKQI